MSVENFVVLFVDVVVVEFKDVYVGYLLGVNIFNGVNFIVCQGELIGIIGFNGVGKLMLLKLIFGMVNVCSGDIIVNGESIVGLKVDKFVKCGVVFVFQMNNVFLLLLIEENLQMGFYQNFKIYVVCFEFVIGIFVELGKCFKQCVGLFFGGECQMVVMLWVFMMDLLVLFFDEFFVGFFFVCQDDVFICVFDINKVGVMMIMVEQNVWCCLQICDCGYVFDQGKDVYEGIGCDLLNDFKVIGFYFGMLGMDVV